MLTFIQNNLTPQGSGPALRPPDRVLGRDGNHPHPGFKVAENTVVVAVNDYYFAMSPGGYPYHDGGYMDVDPQLDCHAWCDGHNLYAPGWCWTWLV
jgi:hypothetical protein